MCTFLLSLGCPACIYQVEVLNGKRIYGRHTVNKQSWCHWVHRYLCKIICKWKLCTAYSTNKHQFLWSLALFPRAPNCYYYTEVIYALITARGCFISWDLIEVCFAATCSFLSTETSCGSSQQGHIMSLLLLWLITGSCADTFSAPYCKDLTNLAVINSQQTPLCLWMSLSYIIIKSGFWKLLPIGCCRLWYMEFLSQPTNIKKANTMKTCLATNSGR